MDGPPLYFYRRQSQAVASAREGYLCAQRSQGGVFMRATQLGRGIYARNATVTAESDGTTMFMAVGKYLLQNFALIYPTTLLLHHHTTTGR
jgi:hypothetical protein